MYLIKLLNVSYKNISFLFFISILPFFDIFSFIIVIPFILRTYFSRLKNCITMQYAFHAIHEKLIVSRFVIQLYRDPLFIKKYSVFINEN